MVFFLGPLDSPLGLQNFYLFYLLVSKQATAERVGRISVFCCHKKNPRPTTVFIFFKHQIYIKCSSASNGKVLVYYQIPYMRALIDIKMSSQKRILSIRMSKLETAHLEPWGFRLQGGIDVVAPLSVLKVCASVSMHVCYLITKYPLIFYTYNTVR